MKFSIQRSAVLPAFTQALETCSSSGKHGDSYADFLVESNEGKLSVTSINSYAQQTVQVAIKDPIEEDVAFTVTGRNLVDFLRQCRDEELNCTYNPNNHALQLMSASTARKMKYAFSTGKSDEFQPITFQPGKKTFNVSGAALAAAFAHTYAATNRESAMRPFTAVKLVIGTCSLAAEATDRSRVAVYKAEIPDTGLKEDFAILIPREVAESLSKVLGKVDDVTIRPCNRHVVFEWSDTELVSSLETDENGEFIALSTFFDNEPEAQCRVSRDDFLRSLKLAALLDSEAEVFVSCVPDGIQLQTVENEIGAGIDVLPAEEIEGQAECCLPLKHLQRAVEGCEEAWVCAKWSTLESGEVGFSVEDGNGSLKHFVFPVRSREYEETE
ncbi:MAG: hypothetical protein JSS66_05240 [Armatimonadetes bacterium]|nr:hypothetical protein [Armatimonadota bacterium]